VQRLSADDQLILGPDEVWPQDIGALSVLDGGPPRLRRPLPNRGREAEFHLPLTTGRLQAKARPRRPDLAELRARSEGVSDAETAMLACQRAGRDALRGVVAEL
jgi:hypothetical protein